MAMTCSHGQPCTDSMWCSVREMSSRRGACRTGTLVCLRCRSPWRKSVVKAAEYSSRRLVFGTNPRKPGPGNGFRDPHFPILVCRKPRVGYRRRRLRSGQIMTCRLSGTPHLDLVSLHGGTKTACPTSGPSYLILAVRGRLPASRCVERSAITR